MKIIFSDKSYVELQNNNGKIILIISAKDHSNPNKKISNAAEMTQEEFKQLISEVI